MSSRELQRVEVLARVQGRALRLKDAAEILAVSYRQAKRLWQRYRQQGAGGLQHRSAGRAWHRATSEKLRERVLQLVRQKYWGAPGERFGPTLAGEHLESEDGIRVDAETLRRWMLGAGLWSRTRRRQGYRQQRERKQHFGEMVQLDGSFHAWLEERGPAGCLMNMVDDATSTVLFQLGEQETTWAAANVLRAWIEKYGVPLALYVDWKNVYHRRPTSRELLRGEVPGTQFGRMCQKLGIRIIAASSPQAKGRVERNSGVHQDRLIKKMRRKNICTHAMANPYFRREYLPVHNNRFALQPAKPHDYHRPAPSARELQNIFRLETVRTVGHDWVLRHHSRFFQLQRQNQPWVSACSKVLVCEWQDGRVAIEYRGQPLRWVELAARLVRETPRAPQPQVLQKRSPAADHPWRRDYRGTRVRPVVVSAPLVGVPACATP